MTTWPDLVDYVRSNYKIGQERSDLLGLVFELEGMRTQLVFIELQLLMGGQEEWIQVWSPIADANTVNLRAVLEECGRMVCGGLAIVDGHVVLRDAIPLADMDIREFERPLMLVTSSADSLEKKFSGDDKH